jgi:glycosyltransferase involved in cell wall biosynthesis
MNIPAGLGRYARSLAEALLPLIPPEQGPQIFYNHIPGRSQPIPSLAQQATYRVHLGYKPWRMGVLLGHHLGLGFNRLVPGTTLFHATEHLLMPLRGVKTVLTVHDLIYKLFPEHHKRLNYWYLNHAMPIFTARADAIIAISQATKRDLMSHYGLPGEKIHVIYEAAAPHFRPAPADSIADVRRRYGLPEKFLLVVGTIEPRKNYPRLLEAMAAIRKDHPDLCLVVAGSKGWLYEPFFQKIEALGADSWVKLTGYVADEDLPALYSAARALVMPSVYEGFGLPILEAMACGTPVISSQAASLPELGGEAARYFDPHQVESISECLCQTLGPGGDLAAMTAAGLVQVAQFSWERAAQETWALYQNLLGSGEKRDCSKI